MGAWVWRATLEELGRHVACEINNVEDKAPGRLRQKTVIWLKGERSKQQRGRKERGQPWENMAGLRGPSPHGELQPETRPIEQNKRQDKMTTVA